MQGMDQATHSQNRCLRLLLAGTEGKDLDSLRDLLVHANCNLQVDCVHSFEEARKQLDRGIYDMLLCDCECSRDLGLLAEKRKLPVIFLGDQIEEPAMQRTLQSTACNIAPGWDPSSPCMALAILCAEEKYQKEKQRQYSEEMLNKLQRRGAIPGPGNDH
jgi:hypothetical protein